MLAQVTFRLLGIPRNRNMPAFGEKWLQRTRFKPDPEAYPGLCSAHPLIASSGN